MNLYLRLLYLILRYKFFFKEPVMSPRSHITTNFTVMPNDIDINGHVNNGRYLSILDLARIDFMGRIGLLNSLFKFGWRPIVGETQISFFKSLKLGDRFSITTKLESIDDKWFLLSHDISKGKVLVAQSNIRAVLIDKNKKTLKAKYVLSFCKEEFNISPVNSSNQIYNWIQGLEFQRQRASSFTNSKDKVQ